MIQKVGRNEKCPCGSGKKFKHCHGNVYYLNFLNASRALALTFFMINYGLGIIFSQILKSFS